MQYIGSEARKERKISIFWIKKSKHFYISLSFLPSFFLILVQFFGWLGLISAGNVLGNLRLTGLEGRKCRWLVEDFHHHFRVNVTFFFVFLSWHGLKDFLLLRKLDDKFISPWALKLMTLQTVYKGVDPRGAVTGRIGWWERSFFYRSARTSKPIYFRKIARLYLITERPMKKHKPRKNFSTTPPDTKTQKHFVEKRERTPATAEISRGADDSGAEVRKN